MAADPKTARVRVADFLQKAGDKIRGAFTEGPNAALLVELRTVEPERDPLGLGPRALGVLSIESDEIAIVLDPKNDARKVLMVRVAPGPVAVTGGIAPRRTPDGPEGFLRWAALRVSPERVHTWTFAARTSDRVVVVRDRAMLVDAAARDDLPGARDKLRSGRVAILADRRYAMLMGEAPAKVVVGKDRAGDVAAIALDFAP